MTLWTCSIVSCKNEPKRCLPATLRRYACVRAAFEPILTDPTKEGMLGVNQYVPPRLEGIMFDGFMRRITCRRFFEYSS